MVRKHWYVLAVLLIVGLVSTGAAIASFALRPPEQATLRGAVLEPARTLEDFSLRKLSGETFRKADLAGKVSVVFFGYTYCPDICPMTLAEMTKLRRELGADAKSVDMYFVSFDPARDTPDRLREYLANFDSGIIGLTGNQADLEKAESSFGALVIKREDPKGGNAYTFDHSAGMFVVNRDARVQEVFGAGMATADMAADLRVLLKAPAMPDSMPAVTKPGDATKAGALVIEAAWARATNSASQTSAMYFTIRNTGSKPDVLTGASAAIAGTVEVHKTELAGGMMQMRPAGDVMLPAGQSLTFAPGGLHVMLMDLKQPLAGGSTFPAKLKFKEAGEVTVQVDVRAATTETAAPMTKPVTVQVADVWARAVNSANQTSAMYFTVRNTGAQSDVLLSASAAIAGAVEVHKTEMTNGVMQMKPAGDVMVPAGQLVKFEPGGLHVMLLDLKQPLTAGATFPAKLTFRDAGEVMVQVEVKAATTTMAN